MFNIEKYEDIQNKLKNYEDKINYLEELKKYFIDQVRNTEDNCSHDLILSYDSDGNVKKSQCLFCDSYMELDDNVDIFSEKYIDDKNIIDVIDLVSEYSRRLSIGKNSVLVLKAKEKLIQMINFAKMNNQEFKLDLVKNVLSNTMIAYDEELKKQRKRLTKNNTK